MSEVKSLNPYALLGNTSDQDSDREPEPPTKAIDKPTARHGKRDVPKAAPVAPADANTSGRGGADRRRGGFTGSEAAFRDRATGRSTNRDKPTEDADGATRGRGRGRGARGPRRGGDRRDRTGQNEHPKQTDEAWGRPTGDGEWADEKAGDAIAKAEVKEGGFDANPDTPVDADGNQLDADGEPESSNKSYAEYLAEKAAAKLEGLGLKEARQANEGAKDNEKWSAAKALDSNDGEEYFVGAGKKDVHQRNRKQKELVEINYTISSEDQARDREGGRGRGRGGRGGRGEGRGGSRGEGRGGRGDFGGRGDRGDRGGDRGGFGGRGRGDRGDFGGRGRSARGVDGGASDAGPAVNTNDTAAFPSLGVK